MLTSQLLLSLTSVYLSPYSHQELICVCLPDEETPGLYGFLHVIVHSAKGFKESASKFLTAHVWHSILLHISVRIHVCQQHTGSIWWSVWSQQDLPQIGPIQRQIDVQRAKTKWSGSCISMKIQTAQTQPRWTAGSRALAWQVAVTGGRLVPLYSSCSAAQSPVPTSKTERERRWCGNALFLCYRGSL